MSDFEAPDSSVLDLPRSIGTLFQDGHSDTGLIEWTTASPKALEPFLEMVDDRVPTEQNRPEEASTLKIVKLFHFGQKTALIYRCDQLPMDLYDALTRIPKPSNADRRVLGRSIATKVRSLFVHFDLHHPALRPESFVFLCDGDKPDLTKPFILDWGRPSSPSMHQDPEYRPGSNLWSHHVWSLMMILSEIAEWKPLSKTFQDGTALRLQKAERKRVLMDPKWKGVETAEVFRHGFGFLEKDQGTLEKYSKWEVKRFYDRLCELL